MDKLYIGHSGIHVRAHREEGSQFSFSRNHSYRLVFSIPVSTGPCSDDEAFLRPYVHGGKSCWTRTDHLRLTKEFYHLQAISTHRGSGDLAKDYHCVHCQASSAFLYHHILY